MAKVTEKTMRDNCRIEFVDFLVEMLEAQGIDCYRTKDGEFGIERWDEQDNKRNVKIVVSIPTGARGESADDAYPMYAMAEDYQQKKLDKAAKAAAKEKSAK